MALTTSQCMLVAVLVMCIYLLTHATAAPTERLHRPHASADGTKVSIVMDALADDTVFNAPSRNKRSTRSDPAHLTPEQARSRRSAVLLLHTSLHFCNQHPLFCRRVEIDEGDVKIKVRLEEE